VEGIMPKVTFDVIQQGETIVMIGKVKSVQRAAEVRQDTVQSGLIEDRHERGDDAEFNDE